MTSAISLEVPLGEIADKIGAQCEVDSELLVKGISTLESANVDEVSFLSSKKHAKHLPGTKALAVIIKPDDSHLYSGNKLIMDDPYLGFARLAAIFDTKYCSQSGICSSAVIADTVTIADNVWVGSNAVVEDKVTLADGVFVGAGCYIGKSSLIGKGTKILANASIMQETTVGENCLLHAGCVIGDDGFGFAKDGDKWLKIPQTGKVVIGDDVEIGSNTTIDCGALEDTVIANGVKLDNQIQVGHNVYIGENTAIAAGTGIAGSTRIGKNCTIAGMVGLVGHIEICDDVQVTGKSMVTKSITEPGVYSSGWAARKSIAWSKMVAGLSRLSQLNKRVKLLEQKLLMKNK